MRPFEDYFNEESVIWELCKARVGLAVTRHNALFFDNISRGRSAVEKIQPHDWGNIAPDIFPKRRQWGRYRPRDRSAPSLGANLESLFHATLALRKSRPDEQWVFALGKAVSIIRDRALSTAPFLFGAPKIEPAEKNPEKKEYRPLAVFVLADRVIDSLTARYFRETLDCALLPSCVAFRSGRDGRHEALEKLLQAISEHRAVGLYVAECDIRGFYDCVHHSVATTALDSLILDAQARCSGLLIDNRAIGIFQAYLSTYSFLETIKRKAEPDLQKRQPKATYPWPEADLLRLNPGDLNHIGIPQGGSLSTFIANAVLHAADKEMDRFDHRKRITYVRYCDDMILLASERKTCEEAFALYRRAMKNELRLPIHQPEHVGTYQGLEKTKFWQTKSKRVYHWVKPSPRGGVPWIQFIGYQIRYDGLVRVRPKSIEKETKKLTAATDRLLRILNSENVARVRRSKASIIHRFRQKLISMAVGRRKLVHPAGELMPKSWAYGFRGLAGKNVLAANLKVLDRHRERQLWRVRQRLRSLKLPRHLREAEDENALRFYGCPFSYWGQFRPTKEDPNETLEAPADPTSERIRGSTPRGGAAS